MKKSDEETVEILEAFDATGSAYSAGQLAGVDAKTVRRYVAARDEGRPVTGPSRRPRMIDGHLPKLEEWVERGKGEVRAAVIHERLVAVGFTGTERTTRRAVAAVKAAWRAGHRRAAVELAALVDAEAVDAALGVAAAAGRFAEGYLATIVGYLAIGATTADLVIPDETHSIQPGTGAWAGFSSWASSSAVCGPEMSLIASIHRLPRSRTGLLRRHPPLP